MIHEQFQKELLYYYKFIFEKKGKYNISSFSIITLPQIVEENPDLDWDWEKMSNNKNINIQFIRKNRDKTWDWGNLSANSCITMEDFERNRDLPWNIFRLCSNINLDILTLLKLIEDTGPSEIDWGNASMCNKITIEQIYSNPELPWEDISWRDDLTLEHIIRNPWPNWSGDWYWEHISSNKNITIQMIEDNPLYPWNINGLSFNPNISIDYVKKYINGKWNWLELSSNPGIKIKDIEDNLDLPWDWECISRNKNLTIEFIRKHKDKFTGLWREISENHSINYQIIQENPDLPWEIRFFLKYNPNSDFNLAIDVIEIFSHWDIEPIENYVKSKVYKRHISALKIQSWWRDIRVDERKKTGRRLVMQRFLEI